MPTTRRKRANPPDEPDGDNNAHGQQPSNPEPSPAAEQPAAGAEKPGTEALSAEQAATGPFVPTPTPQAPIMNGDRFAAERQEYQPAPEPGRRTTFRRPAQQPVLAQQPAAPVPPPAPASVATHEITLPLGNLLHLAYNPAYTGSEEARSTLLHQLADESKAGGRGRCWNCGSLAIVYDCWNTRSRNLGDVGIAICEICGVWSVL